ncbi:MAG: hypothetical protein R3182_05140, partial [Draconibacterium sp.]|nr:hypothetical protein [Draconibacterium sp.]
MLKRILKITGTTLIIITLIIVVVLFVSLRLIDKTPYYKTAYYKQTTENLSNAINTKKEVFGKLEVGFASVNITPEISNSIESHIEGKFKSVPLAGYGDRI